jgi:hypothetical protein
MELESASKQKELLPDIKNHQDGVLRKFMDIRTQIRKFDNAWGTLDSTKEETPSPTNPNKTPVNEIYGKMRQIEEELEEILIMLERNTELYLGSSSVSRA